MSDDIPPLGPTLDFLRLIWGLNHAVERLSVRMSSSLGITAQQRMVIRCVGKYPGITAGALARLLHTDAGTISTTIARLEQRRLLKRTRDPRDGRRITLGLTIDGRAFDRPAPHTVEAAVERMLATAPTRQLANAVEVITRLTEVLDEEAELIT
jgi:DNA-binding MarR family transcriptional regulator